MDIKCGLNSKLHFNKFRPTIYHLIKLVSFSLFYIIRMRSWKLSFVYKNGFGGAHSHRIIVNFFRERLR